SLRNYCCLLFFFQAEDGIRDLIVTGVQTCALPISVLQSSGSLNLKMGGAPVVPPLEAEELFGIIGKSENAWIVTPNAEEHTRRKIGRASCRERVKITGVEGCLKQRDRAWYSERAEV